MAGLQTIVPVSGVVLGIDEEQLCNDSSRAGDHGLSRGHHIHDTGRTQHSPVVILPRAVAFFFFYKSRS